MQGEVARISGVIGGEGNKGAMDRLLCLKKVLASELCLDDEGESILEMLGDLDERQLMYLVTCDLSTEKRMFLRVL